MVRKGHSVRKTASYGTRRIFRSTRCKKQASTVREGYSVPETAFWCTERIFKGALNSLLLHRMHFRKRKNSTCCIERVSKGPRNSTCCTECVFRGPQNIRHRRLWTASCRTGRIFSARNGLREEASKHKKRMYSLEMP